MIEERKLVVTKKVYNQILWENKRRIKLPVIFKIPFSQESTTIRIESKNEAPMRFNYRVNNFEDYTIIELRSRIS